MAACGMTCDNFGGKGCRRWFGDVRESNVVIIWISWWDWIDGGVSIDGDGLDELRIGGFGAIFTLFMMPGLPSSM